MSRDVFLAGKDSLRLLRAARRREDLAIVEAPRAHLVATHDCPAPKQLAAVLPDELLPLDADNPLELTFFGREARSQSGLVNARCLLTALPEGAFLEVVRVDGRAWEDIDGTAFRLFVESPPLSLIHAQQLLGRLSKDKALNPSASLFRLIALAMELCGTYARDPRDPVGGPCVFGLEPVGTTAQLRAFLAETHRLRGIKAARRAAIYALDGSGSPEETLLALAFSLPFSLGGIMSPPLVLNEPIAWPEGVVRLVEHRTMRPDISFPGFATVAEYNGLTHMDRRSFEEDQRRIRDYQLCGISVFPATYRDVSTSGALATYLARVAHSIDAHGLLGYERRVRVALMDEGVSYLRRVLLSQLLPAVPSEKSEHLGESRARL